MNISFYAPFKPIDHPNPSGDRVIGKGLVAFLEKNGYAVTIVSRFRMRWIYVRPLKWPFLLKEFLRVLRKTGKRKPDLWITYHTYYKAPDLLGPFVCRLFGIDYVIFQGIYSTKTRRRFRTWPGYWLNLVALTSARHLFTNRKEDERNLLRIIPPEKITYIAPGIDASDFCFSKAEREKIRNVWKVGDTPVIVSAAMFRPDVKSRGLSFLIRCCGVLMRKGISFYLVIAGDGKKRFALEKLAHEHLKDRCLFAGEIRRDKMSQFYSAGDIFAFPGINESLGMVYLEAGACGLPVVAFDNGGIGEVVRNGKTGYLVPPFDMDGFGKALTRLLLSESLRSEIGKAAREYVLSAHSSDENYGKMLRVLSLLYNERGKYGAG